jgi:hypothetical protein
MSEVPWGSVTEDVPMPEMERGGGADADAMARHLRLSRVHRSRSGGGAPPRCRLDSDESGGRGVQGGDGTHFKGPLQLGLRGKVSERPQNRASIGALLEREKCAPTTS